MRKINLYSVKAEYLYGDDKDAKRARQLEAVAQLGLNEFEMQVICTAEQALYLLRSGYAGEYMRPSDVAVVAVVDGGPDVEALFSILADKIAAMPQASVNERCGQQQPGNALMAVCETQLMEDACTNALQEQLAAGWRIIAVQPQPDQRRPDYILGRPMMQAMR